MSIAGSIAQIFTSLKELGVADRAMGNDLLRKFLEAHPEIVGAWTVWEPNAYDGRDSEFIGAPGHDLTGRFVPLWHRYGGEIRYEANTNYDKPGSGHWYLAPSRRAEEMVIDPYVYPMAGRLLFITTQAAPIFAHGKCIGVAGIDVLLDSLCPDSTEESGLGVAELEMALRRGHALVDPDGVVQSWSGNARSLMARFGGMRITKNHPLPGKLLGLYRKWSMGRKEARGGKLEERLTIREGNISLRFSRHPDSDCAVMIMEAGQDEGTKAPLQSVLTARQMEVLSWIERGKSNDEIAIILGASGHTVKHHVEHILARLGVENRYAAALTYRCHQGMETGEDTGNGGLRAAGRVHSSS